MIETTNRHNAGRMDTASRMRYVSYLLVRLAPNTSFPVDCMRYDRCHPAEERDSGQLAQSMQPFVSAEHEVLVERYHVDPDPAWSYSKWLSHSGVQVESVPPDFKYRRKDFD